MGASCAIYFFSQICVDCFQFSTTILYVIPMQNKNDITQYLHVTPHIYIVTHVTHVCQWDNQLAPQGHYFIYDEVPGRGVAGGIDNGRDMNYSRDHR